MSLHLDKTKSWYDRTKAERRFASGGRLNSWRNIIFNYKLINSYTDSHFINTLFTQRFACVLPKDEKCIIADFGCGYGHVAQTITSQLKKRHHRHVDAIGIDIFSENFLKIKKEAPEILPVLGDLKSLPFTTNSFHAGILRFALPFIRKDLQPQVLKEIYRVMKEGSSVILLNDGALDTKTTEAYETLFAQGAASNSPWTVEQIKANRHFPSYERLKIMAEVAGFQVAPATDLTNIALGYLSPEIYAKRFNLTKGQHQDLKNIFKVWKKENVLPFEPNSLRVQWPMYTCVLRKERSGPSP